jgi:hypothetical protein
MISKFTDPVIAGCNVYISEESGKGFRKCNSEPLKPGPFMVTGLVAGRKYYMITRCTNAKGQEGPPSQECIGVAFPSKK